MNYKIFLSKNALTCLSKFDKQIAKRIVDKLQYYETSPNPLFYAKKLKDPTTGQYGLRVGNYRVLFDINQEGEMIILYVLTIKHRRDAYL